MNNYILRLHIHNFKSYEDKVFDFSNSNLILLDGPNGFGKSSLFDALELLFTGRIRRYLDIQNVFDGRKPNESIPFINNNNSDIVFIKAEICIEGKKYFLKRKVFVKDLSTKIDFSRYQLYLLHDWDDMEGEYISDEAKLLSSLSGSDWLRNYSLYNYIEQEESLHKLKQNEKNRANDMYFMFNVKEEEEKLKKYQNLKRTLNSKKTSIDTEIKQLEIKRKDYSTEHKEILTIEYISLFPKDKNINWDKETPKLENIVFSDLLKDGGELDDLQYLVDNRNQYYADSYNRFLDQVVLSPLFSDFIRYYHFLPQRLIFEEIVLADNFIEVITGKEFIFTYPLDKLRYPSFLQQYKENLEDVLQSIRVLKKSQDANTSLLAEFKSERDNFIARINQIKNEDAICPLCNYQWKDKATIMYQIEYKTNLINDALKSINPQLEKELNHINVALFPEIMKTIERFVCDSGTSVDFARAITKLRDEQFSPIVNKLTKVCGEQWKEHLSHTPNIEAPLRTDSLKNLLKGKKIECDHSLVHEELKPLISKYFNDNWEDLMRFDSTLIEKKRIYLKSCWINVQKTLFSQLKDKIEEKETEKVFIENNIRDLDKVIYIFKNELKKHVAQIITDIEIIFHIYSGRILRQINSSRQGLFIKNENGSEIRFLSSCNNGNDALYSMSSGQLSGLVLAFTLALNKRYSQTKFLFIDDPVQSMDDMNSWGLIELLRTEFKESQIIISTHDSDFPYLLSYKFNKMDLKVKSIALKNETT